MILADDVTFNVASYALYIGETLVANILSLARSKLVETPLRPL